MLILCSYSVPPFLHLKKWKKRQEFVLTGFSSPCVDTRRHPSATRKSILTRHQISQHNDIELWSFQKCKKAAYMFFPGELVAKYLPFILLTMFQCLETCLQHQRGWTAVCWLNKMNVYRNNLDCVRFFIRRGKQFDLFVSSIYLST